MRQPKPIQLRFQEFMTKHDLSQQKIAEIALEYANSGPEYARTFFSQKYSISPAVFYGALEYSIIARLVDKTTESRIFLKLACNNSQHGGQDGVKRSVEHKNHVLRLQREYAVAFKRHIDSFSEETIFKICMDFRDGMAISQIAKKNKTSSRVVKILLGKGLDLLFDTYHSVKRRMGK